MFRGSSLHSEFFSTNESLGKRVSSGGKGVLKELYIVLGEGSLLQMGKVYDVLEFLEFFILRA